MDVSLMPYKLADCVCHCPMTPCQLLLWARMKVRLCNTHQCVSDCGHVHASAALCGVVWMVQRARLCTQCLVLQVAVVLRKSLIHVGWMWAVCPLLEQSLVESVACHFSGNTQSQNPFNPLELMSVHVHIPISTTH